MKKTIKRISMSAAAAICAAALTGAASGAGKEAFSGTDTLYCIGSVSKVYTVTAAMQLADKGLLDIDKPVTEYIPEFEMNDPRYRDITVRMLMNHSSGIMGTTQRDSFLIADNDCSYHDELLDALKGQRLKADPGEFSVYCNDGFDLLEQVVERVSGMDFTDYMMKYIVQPIGGVQTGSYKNAFLNPYHVKVFDMNNSPISPEYHIGIGTGGVLSTSAELAAFGSTFFAGNNTLLSDKAKAMMSEDQCGYLPDGRYGLGWDDVDWYAENGVKVLTKNGALSNQFATLAVAPEEKISVGVCVSGGSGAESDLLAKCLMNIALEEQGISLKTEEPQYTIRDTIPGEYRRFEGAYTDAGTVYFVSFPDMKYMMCRYFNGEREITEYYKYISDGKFLHVLGDVPNGSCYPDSDKRLVWIEERSNGRTYIVSDETRNFPLVGQLDITQTLLEKLEPNPVSPSAQAAWSDRCGDYYLVSGKYSALAYYSGACINVDVSDELEGYVYCGGLNKIESEAHAAAFVNIPNNGGRDLHDFTAVTIDGAEYLVVDGDGTTYICEKAIPELTADITEITFDKRDAKWFYIGDKTGGSVVSFEISPEVSVYVYDRYDNTLYCTYSADPAGKLTLPNDGKIVFVGEKGASVKINAELCSLCQ